MADGGNELVFHLLDLLALREVARDGDESADFARAPDQLHGHLDGHDAAIGAPVDGFDLAGLDLSAQERLDRLEVVLLLDVRADFPGRHAQQPFPRDAQRARGAVVHVVEAQRIDIVDEDHVEGVVEHVLEVVRARW